MEGTDIEQSADRPTSQSKTPNIDKESRFPPDTETASAVQKLMDGFSRGFITFKQALGSILGF
ncbi:hypothetical protein KC726_05580 [Candidatus Woesebacteria bacterium]|nr:hypothetical protein [Candidatus Woesebacteria bacterium]